MEGSQAGSRALDLYLERLLRGDAPPLERFLAEHPGLTPEERARIEKLARAAAGGAPASDRAAGTGASPGTGASTGASGAGSPSGGPAGELLRRLSAEPPRGTRYQVESEIARGGMGAILRARDPDIGRELAMKVVLGDADARRARELDGARQRHLARFLDEAQITGQLDHPGVVPVHELGVDSEGRLYFTMKLVKGRELGAVFELVRTGAEGWSRTRALTVMLKVCEAMAYAHAKGVIHRDLKPANVMVGEFGEVYVMDWGLARAEGRRDLHDLRLRVDDGASIVTERRREKEAASDSPLLTMDGDIVGTPCYMAPEQALGRLAEVGPRADVYSVGAILYELLTGERPYAPRGERVGNREVLSRLVQGPPRALAEVDPRLPAELAAICERAMQRDPEKRYADMLAMAEDLRAYLENRVVRAYEAGAVAELRKWVARNRPLALVSAAALALALLGLAGFLVQEARRRADAEARNVELAVAREAAEQNAERARANEALAREKEALAVARSEEVLGLSAIQDLQDLTAEADVLWPAVPARQPAYEAWLERAARLVAGLDAHRGRLAALRARAESSMPVAPDEQAFAGTWNTDFGRLAMRSEGTRVVGVYVPPGGGGATALLEGVLREGRLELSFREAATSGTGWFELSPDGARFHGQRKSDTSGNWIPWTGERIRRDADLPVEPRNLGFEEPAEEGDLPPGWERTAFGAPNESRGAPVALDRGEVTEGSASVRLTTGEAVLRQMATTRIHQELSASRYRGRRVRFGGRLRTSEGVLAALLELQVFDEVGRLASAASPYAAFSGRVDWKEVAAVIDVPERATRVRLGATLVGDGSLWVDALALEPVGPDVATTMTEALAADELARRDEYLTGRRAFAFASTQDRWWHAQLERLVDGLEGFADDATGLVRGLSPAHGPGVERRLELARTIEQRSVSGPEAARLWQEAIASIADPAQCPAYGGLSIVPQVGLLPLGRDRASGLWEFAHLPSGEAPRRLANGTLRMKTASSLVLVLVPGGELTLGAQPRDAASARHDPAALPNEWPPHTVALEPFFLSKHEMTQAQWFRSNGENPSKYDVGTALGDQFATMLHPVEQVSWIDCERTLARLGLVLPTEAQWEYAARAGTQTPWWTGEELASLAGAANLPDASVTRAGRAWQEGAAIASLDDGYVAHAPVDAFRANPFGLHNVHGNVWEWCRDWLASYAEPVHQGDGERIAPGTARERVMRGGSFNYAPERSRSTNRAGASPTLRSDCVGVRPARALER